MQYPYGNMGAGPVDIVGAGPVDIIGAGDAIEELLSGYVQSVGADVIAAAARNPSHPQNKVAKLAVAAQNARALNPHAAIAMPTSYTHTGIQQLGSPPTVVGAGATSNPILIQTQRPFKPSKFQVMPNIAAFFDIMTVTIGQNGQFASADPVAGQAFIPTSVDSYVDWETSNPGTPIIVVVRNNDAAPHTFQAAVFGKAVS